MKGVALTQATDRKQAAADRAVPFETGNGVPGARGLEAADVPEKRRKRPLVDADEDDEQLSNHEGVGSSSSSEEAGRAET